MKKILVIGSGGSGKSTFSAQLGKQLHMPVIHLDAHYWQPGWVEPTKAQWLARVHELCQGEQWVMDGNYSGTLVPRLAACDTVIFLDLPRLLCLWRVLSRSLRYWGQTRPDMAEGCPEQFSPEFWCWIWNYPRDSRPRALALIEKNAAGKHIIRLRSAQAVRQFLANSSSAAVQEVSV
ncbi:MAG: hypothetical protein REI12_00820 [Pedobacter sp.]|nr:hypothetical protein [Pedobacter sp.]